MLPEVLDTVTLRTVLLVGVAVVVIGVFVTVRFVTAVTTKLAVVGLLLVVGVALWVERENLAECTDTGSCTFFGRDVSVPRPD